MSETYVPKLAALYLALLVAWPNIAECQEASLTEVVLKNAEALLGAGDQIAAERLLQKITADPLNESDQSWVQQAWNLRAQIAEGKGNLRDALVYHSKSIDLLTTAQELPRLSLSSSLRKRANLLRQLGQFETAASDCAKAMELVDNPPPTGQEKQHRQAMAACLNISGLLERSRGNYDSAHTKYESVLRILEQDLSPNHPSVAAVLSNLGTNDQKKGDFGSARRRLSQALEMLDPNRVEQKQAIATLRHNLAGILESQGELAAARESYLESIELLHSIHGENPNALTATVWASLGMLELELKRPQASIDYLEKALAARVVLFNGSTVNPHIALANQNLAKALLEQGDFEAATKKTLSAIDAQREIYAGQTAHPDLCNSYLLLAKIQEKEGDLDKAIAQSKLAVDAYLSAYPKLSYPDGHGDIAEAMEVLGELQLRSGQASDAIESLFQATEMRMTLAQNFILTAAEAESRRYLSVRLPSPKSMLEAMRVAGWKADEQYAAIMSSRRMVQRAIASRNQWIHKYLKDSEHAARYLTVRRLLDFASGIQEIDPQNRTAILAELRKLTAEKESLERQLADVIAQADKKDDDTSLPRLTEAISSNSALVEIIELGDLASDASRKEYVGFVVTQGSVARVDFGDARAIDDACYTWLQALARPNDHKVEQRVAMEVSGQVWKPIAASLPSNVDRLYLCPDGVFAQIPWIALFSDDQSQRVVDHYTVSLLPFSQLLLQPATDLLSEWTETLLVGDVDYGLSNWSPLPGTVDELAGLTSTMGQLSSIHTTTLRGTEATVENVCQLLPSTRVVHFATHGQFVVDGSEGFLDSGTADRNPLLSSGLVLARSEANGKSQAVVTGEQIAALDLRNLQLATLSACDTGRGKLLYGDGVYGLQQAFHLAGAKSVVASRWRIDDRQTVILMNNFYQQMLHHQLEPARALAAAQKMFLAGSLASGNASRGASRVDASSKPLEADSSQGVHPYYWASFQHSGR